MRKRGSVLALTFLSVLIVVVACGRASEEDINKALGIEPTATLSGEQIAQATESAVAAASAIASGATPVPGSSLPVGDVRLGQQQFQFQCVQCHQASGAGQGPALTTADSPIVALSDQQIFDIVRLGEGHGTQQPVSEMRISDKQLASIIAYIRDQIENADA